MANARGKSIDNTHLSIDTAEERLLIHRDYLSHVLRWTYVARELGGGGYYKKARILDIGCGVDLPLARLLYSNRYIPMDYVGLDYNKDEKFKLDMFEKGRFPINPYGSIDFASKQVRIRKPKHGDLDVDECLFIDGAVYDAEHLLPNTITCFEVLEHVEPSHTRAMLKKIKLIMEAYEKQEKGGEALAYISTPCWDPVVGAADNHVNEIKREALGALIEDLGFLILENYGTFASQKDYKHVMLEEHPEWKPLWDGLHGYFDSNVLANIFAPLYPQYARNNLWALMVKPKTSVHARKFPPLSEVPGPWTSSERWQELASDDAYKMEI